MQSETFNKAYTDYWERAVKKSVDGTHVAGQYEVFELLRTISFASKETALDVGCSFGRMNSVLKIFFYNIYGVDPDDYALKKASEMDYAFLKKGTAEDTGLLDNFFDFFFCWAVFDVCDQDLFINEMRRLLKQNGRFLITGKMTNYYQHDKLAFVAERNAYLKSFPNKFTDLKKLAVSLTSLGFGELRFRIFNSRGDLGVLKYKSYNISQVLENEIRGYEFVIDGVLTTKDCCRYESIGICSSFSRTASMLAKINGFETVNEYFLHYGE